MRAGPAARLAAAWISLLRESLSSSDVDTAAACLRTIAAYVSWIDLGLVVVPDLADTLLSLIADARCGLQAPACACLAEIVAKGMPLPDRLRLIDALRLPGALDAFPPPISSNALRLQSVGALPPTTPASAPTASSSNVDDHVARLINVVFISICAGIQDPQSSSQSTQSNNITENTPSSSLLLGSANGITEDPATIKNRAFATLSAFFPYLLRYLAADDNDISSILFPAISTILLLARRTRKEHATAQFIHDCIPHLLQVVILKLKYPDDEEFRISSDAIETESSFADFRKSLKGFLESICAINSDLYASSVTSAVINTLNVLLQGAMASRPLQSVLAWSDVELALYLLYVFVEAKPFKTSPIYITEPNGSLALLGQMLAKAYDCGVAAYPHISIPFVFFEIVVRHSQFLEQCQTYLPRALEIFVDTRGLHHPVPAVRLRLNYMFLRLVKPLRMLLGPYVERILESIDDLLVIQPRPLPPGYSASSSAAASRSGSKKLGGMGGDAPNGLSALADGSLPLAPGSAEFDSQLYLFEAVGHLISAESVDPQKRAALLQRVLTPIIYAIEARLQVAFSDKNSVGPQDVLLLSDAVTAIGSVSKGFPDFGSSHDATEAQPTTSSKRAMDSASSEIFQQALQRILLVLDQFSDDPRIRDAVRFALQRMIGSVGPAVLDRLPAFLSAGLLSGATATELIDFLPFLSLLVHRFKGSILDILASLWTPLREKIFMFLNQPAAGTDDYLQQLSLRRAYLTFLASLFNADLCRVLTCSENIPHLSTTLMSILLCLDESSDASVHKLVFSLFCKMVYCWAGEVGVEGLPVPLPAHMVAAAEAAVGTRSASAGATTDGVANNAGGGGKKNAGPKLTYSSSMPTPSVAAVDIASAKVVAPSSTSGASGTTPSYKLGGAGSPSLHTPPMTRDPLQGFDAFIYDSIVPAMFELPLRPSFRPTDGQSILVLGEIAQLHKTILDVIGMNYLDFLARVYLPRGCPDSLIQVFLSHVVVCDKKGLRKYLQEFVQSVRDSSGNSS